MGSLLIALTLVHAPCDDADSLAMHVDVSPTQVKLGDVLFVRISIENRGEKPVGAPHSCLLENGTLALRLYDSEENTSYHFTPDGGPMGPGLEEASLAPGASRVVSLLMIPLPRLDRINFRFWDPSHWREDKLRLEKYFLIAECGKLSSAGVRIRIDRRAEEEMAKVLEFYDGGLEAPYPESWDSHRPSLSMFLLDSFPRACSVPKRLAAMEEVLSPGSLRDLLHATRLAAAVYDGHTLDVKRKATAELVRWLDAPRNEIERHWIARQLVQWAQVNKGLREYAFEFVDQMIPRVPLRDRMSTKKTNAERRDRYLEYLRKGQNVNGRRNGDGDRAKKPGKGG